MASSRSDGISPVMYGSGAPPYSTLSPFLTFICPFSPADIRMVRDERLCLYVSSMLLVYGATFIGLMPPSQVVSSECGLGDDELMLIHIANGLVCMRNLLDFTEIFA